MESALNASQVAEATDAFLAALRAGRKPDVEAFAARYPEVAHVLRDMLPALAAVDDSGSDRGSGQQFAEGSYEEPDEALRELGDFRLIRQVGRGGMGVVYEAWQQSLGRRVAIKVLPFAAALDSRQLQRFKNEAQAAAQLHHTHIVPVYAVGAERGVHYYAMQFIEGQTIAALIGGLRRAAGQSPSAPDAQAATVAHRHPASSSPSGGSTARDDSTRGMLHASTSRLTHRQSYFRQVARLGAEAAGALEHSHSLGIVHRDIKPGNLMLDVNGHLWVTDFGLAQVRSDSRLTMTGDLIGTLRYMSPEQLLAGRVPVDHRCDIYSLGATLYELLTLEPAISGDDRQALLRQISFDDPPAARSIDRSIPAELETVVGKAMAKNPADRYATAQELVDDLERFLRDEPIRARRPTLRQRVQKWAQRHRAAVVTGALAAAVLLLAAMASVGIFAAQQRQLAKSREEALAIERAARKQAHQTVNDYFRTISEEVLLAEPGMQPLRQKLMDRARTYYEQFAEESRDDAALSADLAQTNLRLGEIARSLGNDQESEARLRDAASRFAALSKAPDGEQHASEYGASLTGLARLDASQGRFDEAQQNYEEAIRVLSERASSAPSDVEARRRLGVALQSLGQLEMQLGQVEPGAKRFDQALFHLRVAAEEHPSEYAYQDALAGCLGNLGMVALVSGRFPAALEHYQAALAVREKIAQTFPGHPANDSGIARYWHGVASAHSEMHHRTEAAEALARAQEIRERLARENPRVVEYRDQWARGFADLASEQWRAKQRPEALATARRGAEVYRELAQRMPAVLDYRTGLAESLLQVARFQRDVADASQARDTCQEAVEVARALATEQPQVPDFQTQLGQCLVRLAELAGASADFNVERSAAEEAVELFEKLHHGAANAADYRRYLVEAWHCRGLAATRTESWAEARAAFAKAIELNESRQLDEPQADVARSQLAGDRAELGLVELRSGHPAEAVGEFDAARRTAGDSAQVLWELTCTLGRGCRDLPKADQRAACLDAAFAALRAAIAAGFADPEALRTNADLATLREDARFEDVVGSMPAPL